MIHNAVIPCITEHDAKCVENMLDEWIYNNRKFSGGEPEAIRFTLERLIGSDQRFRIIKKALKED